MPSKKKYYFKQKTIKLQALPLFLNLVVTSDVRQYSLAEWDKYTPNRVMGKTVLTEGGSVYVIMADTADIGQCAHEAAHAVSKIMYDIGETQPCINEEVFCYYVQFIVNELDKFRTEVRRRSVSGAPKGGRSRGRK